MWNNYAVHVLCLFILYQKQRSDGGSINTKSSSPRSSHAESKEESEENEEHNQLLESDHV